MTAIKSEAKKRMVDTATRKADDLSLQLCNLTEIVKLAAFAAEARRTLNEISNVKRGEPSLGASIDLRVTHSDAWRDLDDNTGDVLNCVAHQLENINTEFTRTVFALANEEPDFTHNTQDEVSAVMAAPFAGQGGGT